MFYGQIIRRLTKKKHISTNISNTQFKRKFNSEQYTMAACKAFYYCDWISAQKINKHKKHWSLNFRTNYIVQNYLCHECEVAAKILTVNTQNINIETNTHTKKKFWHIFVLGITPQQTLLFFQFFQSLPSPTTLKQKFKFLLIPTTKKKAFNFHHKKERVLCLKVNSIYSSSQRLEP